MLVGMARDTCHACGLWEDPASCLRTSRNEALEVVLGGGATQLQPTAARRPPSWTPSEGVEVAPANAPAL